MSADIRVLEALLEENADPCNTRYQVLNETETDVLEALINEEK